MSGRRLLGVTTTGVLGASLLFLVGCGSSSSNDPQPGASAASDARLVKITLTDAGCNPSRITIPAGPTTFQVTNDGANAVTEFEVLDGGRILGEKENLTPGLSGSFSLELKAGSYSLACPNGSSASTGTLTVTGTADDATTTPAASINPAAATN